MRKLVLTCLCAVLALTAPAAAKPAKRPQRLPLPAGFQPEGIAARGSTLYVGSLKDGSIWSFDARTGRGKRFAAGRSGRMVVGIKVVGNRLLAAGGQRGHLLAFDVRNGRLTRDVDVGGAFINDVTTLGRDAYFTDSTKPVLYAMPKTGSGNARTIPITGDLAYGEGVNANGIVRYGDRLITVQTSTGGLFSIDPNTGVAKQLDLGGQAVPNGDGMLLRGRTLYVVQNQDNRIAVVRLARDGLSGRVVRSITDRDFDVPTTLARSGGALYAVNARFGTTPTPTTPYDVVRVG
jgi:sugar lactone lactonase YvrE